MVQTEIRQLSYIQAVNEALRQELERDPTVIVMGEDIDSSLIKPTLQAIPAVSPSVAPTV